MGLSITQILGPDGLCADVRPDWESREGQLQMATTVLDRIEAGGHLVVEAPTGIGKTLAYLVPALLSGRRVVVSTHTKTLQDQIASKDLPFLEEALAEAGWQLTRSEPELSDLDLLEDRPIRYALMKGRANYLCLDRLDRKGRQSKLPIFRDDGLLEEIRQWGAQTLRGDRAELRMAEELPIWSELDARSETCVGHKCARYDQCFVVRMRREAESADLIIVNHHLLLADLALRAEARLTGRSDAFGEVIPKPDVLIIDEAHALEEIASDYFGGRVSSEMLERFHRDAREWSEELVLGPSDERPTGLVEQAIRRADDVFAALPRLHQRTRIVRPEDEDSLDDDVPWDSVDPGPDPEHEDAFDLARERSQPARAALIGLASYLDGHADDPIAESLARRARTMASTLAFILDAADSDFVFWAEQTARNSSLGASPIELSELLREHLFELFQTVVLTSATLTTSGDAEFDFFLRRVGAPEDTQTEKLDSPFDFRSQAVLYLPRQMPEPDHRDFGESFAEAALDLIDRVGGGAFLLFTSRRALEAAYSAMRERLVYPAFRQGDAPKASLVRRFVEEAPAVLFGTASFWEGVDVPGDPLRLVVVDRLPFAAPSDPLVKARMERIERDGLDPFARYQIPQAVLRLRQAFGRLIRTKLDRGVVAVMDPRLRARRYGQRFLRALPPARRITDTGELSHWLRGPTREEELAADAFRPSV